MTKRTFRVYVAGAKRLASLGLETVERFPIALIPCRGRYFTDLEDQIVVHTDARRIQHAKLKLEARLAHVS